MSEHNTIFNNVQTLISRAFDCSEEKRRSSMKSIAVTPSVCAQIFNGKLSLFYTNTVPIIPICATIAKVDIMAIYTNQ
jgi:hypothetical protein